MAPPRKRPEGERWAEFVADYQGGMPTVEMAAKYAAEVQTIRYWASTADPPIRRKPKHVPAEMPANPDCTFEQALAVLKAAHAAYQAALPPTLARIVIPIDYPAIFLNASDVHAEDPAVDIGQFWEDCCVWAETPGLYVGLGADFRQNAVKQNRGGHDSSRVQLGLEVMAGIYRKLAGSSLYRLKGNHEEWTDEAVGVDVDREQAKANQVVYLGAAADIELVIGGQTYLGRVSHQLPGHSYFNPAHPGMRFLMEHGRTQYDFVVSEHIHGKPICQPHIYDDCHVWLYRSSGYQLGGKYSQGKGIKSITKPIVPALVFWPNQHRIQGYMDWRQAIADRNAVLELA